jgi:hypothetical protein
MKVDPLRRSQSGSFDPVGDTQRPAPVANHLTLKVAPLADTTRYDRLRNAAVCVQAPQDEESRHAN